MSYRRVAMLKTPTAFREHVTELGIDLPFDEKMETGPDAPLARPYTLPGGFTVGNRLCVLPMEGWDGTLDGHPSELTFRRWERFGLSGAKLIFGGEATAVRHDGRANPNQLVINEDTLPDLVRLRETLIAAHTSSFGPHSADDLYIGLQLTHSGRFCRPNGKKLEPAILYPHPVLNRKFGLPADYPVMTRRPDRPADRGLRGRGRARAARRLPVRRCEALPRLPGPRVPQRLRSPRQVWRQLREPHALPAERCGCDSCGRARAGDRRTRAARSTSCRSAPARMASACRRRGARGRIDGRSAATARASASI